MHMPTVPLYGKKYLNIFRISNLSQEVRTNWTKYRNYLLFVPIFRTTLLLLDNRFWPFLPKEILIQMSNAFKKVIYSLKSWRVTVRYSLTEYYMSEYYCDHWTTIILYIHLLFTNLPHYCIYFAYFKFMWLIFCIRMFLLIFTSCSCISIHNE